MFSFFLIRFLLFALAVGQSTQADNTSLSERSAAIKLVDSLSAESKAALQLVQHLTEAQIQEARAENPDGKSDLDMQTSTDGSLPTEEEEVFICLLVLSVFVLVVLVTIGASANRRGARVVTQPPQEDTNPAESISNEMRLSRRAEALEQLRRISLPADASTIDRGLLLRLEASLTPAITALSECCICYSEACHLSAVHGHERICAPCMRTCVEAKLSSGLAAQCPHCCLPLTLSEIAQTGVEQRELRIAESIIQGKVQEQVAFLREFRDVLTEDEAVLLARVAGDGQRDPATAAYISEATTICPSCSAPCVRVDGCPRVRCFCGQSFTIAQAVPGEGEPQRQTRQANGAAVMISLVMVVATFALLMEEDEDFYIFLGLIISISMLPAMVLLARGANRLMVARRERLRRRELLGEMGQAAVLTAT